MPTPQQKGTYKISKLALTTVGYENDKIKNTEALSQAAVLLSIVADFYKLCPSSV